MFATQSQNSGFGTSADKECTQEPPPTLESLNVPGPKPSNSLNTQHVKADSPSSSNLVPVPVSQTQTLQPVDPPPLRRSTRRRILRKILDLQFAFKLNCGLEFKLELSTAMVELFELETIAL